LRPSEKPVFDDDVPAFHVPVLVQSTKKSIDQERPAVARADGQEADPVDLLGLFTGGGRPLATK
jgi:hypothetical protein